MLRSAPPKRSRPLRCLHGMLRSAWRTQLQRPLSWRLPPGSCGAPGQLRRTWWGWAGRQSRSWRARGSPAPARGAASPASAAPCPAAPGLQAAQRPGQPPAQLRSFTPAALSRPAGQRSGQQAEACMHRLMHDTEASGRHRQPCRALDSWPAHVRTSSSQDSRLCACLTSIAGCAAPWTPGQQIRTAACSSVHTQILNP